MYLYDTKKISSVSHFFPKKEWEDMQFRQRHKFHKEVGNYINNLKLGEEVHPPQFVIKYWRRKNAVLYLEGKSKTCADKEVDPPQLVSKYCGKKIGEAKDVTSSAFLDLRKQWSTSSGSLNEMEFPCVLCEYIFPTEDDFELHVRSKIFNVYLCCVPTCGAHLFGRSPLYRHQATHIQQDAKADDPPIDNSMSESGDCQNCPTHKRLKSRWDVQRT